MSDLPAVFTVKDAAQYFRRSTKTIYRRIQAGQIKSYKEGTEHRIRLEWIREYEEACIDATAT